jgi:hypothetical protein
MTLMARRRSRVPAECGERPCASGTRAGTQRNDSRIAIWLPAAVRRVAPGSRVSLCSPGHERGAREVAAREANRWPSFPIHDVKQRSVVRSRGALLRPGLSVSSHVPSLSRPPASPRGFGASGRRDSSNSVPPMRGGWSADRRTHSFGRACDARPPCPGATGTSLGAPPWRFSDADPRSRLPAVEPEPQRLPAPAVKAWRSGSGPPALRFAPQRGTPLLAPSFRIVSRKRPSEPGCESCTTNSIRSQ